MLPPLASAVRCARRDPLSYGSLTTPISARCHCLYLPPTKVRAALPAASVAEFSAAEMGGECTEGSGSSSAPPHYLVLVEPARGQPALPADAAARLEVALRDTNPCAHHVACCMCMCMHMHMHMHMHMQHVHATCTCNMHMHMHMQHDCLVAYQ